MNYRELLKKLVKRKALIVHCSRPGRADEDIATPLFPIDLQEAIDSFDNRGEEICCSVIWPGHTSTFGAVGIILRPRSTGSITSICSIDAGSYPDPTTRERVGFGSEFSEQAVRDTFDEPSDHNEWSVRDADTIGIFVHPEEPWEIAKRVTLDTIPGYEPGLEVWANGEEQIVTVKITLAEIAARFPDLPIYSLSSSGIIRLDRDCLVPVEAADLYKKPRRKQADERAIR